MVLNSGHMVESVGLWENFKNILLLLNLESLGVSPGIIFLESSSGDSSMQAALVTAF